MALKREEHLEAVIREEEEEERKVLLWWTRFIVVTWGTTPIVDEAAVECNRKGRSPQIEPCWILTTRNERWLPFPCDVYFSFQMVRVLCLFMLSILNEFKIFHNPLTNFLTLCRSWLRISWENVLTKSSIYSMIFRSSSYSFLICSGLTIRELSRFSEKKLKLEKHALDQYADVLERLLNVVAIRLIHI